MRALELITLVEGVALYSCRWGAKHEKDDLVQVPDDQSIDNLIHALSDSFRGDGYEIMFDPAFEWDWPEVVNLTGTVSNLLWGRFVRNGHVVTGWVKCARRNSYHIQYVLGDPRKPELMPPANLSFPRSRIIT